MVEATVKLVSGADWRAVRNQTDPPLVEREHDRVYCYAHLVTCSTKTQTNFAEIADLRYYLDRTGVSRAATLTQTVSICCSFLPLPS